MIRCYRDSRGFNRVDVLKGHPNIASFLEQDVQGNDLAAREYLDQAQSVAEGRQAQWSGTGNAHTVTITPTSVTIVNVWDEERGIAELSLDEFKECLKSWLACISGETSDS